MHEESTCPNSVLLKNQVEIFANRQNNIVTSFSIHHSQFVPRLSHRFPRVLDQFLETSHSFQAQITPGLRVLPSTYRFDYISVLNTYGDALFLDRAE